MTTNDYLPGDRVQYDANQPGSIAEYRGATGTFKNTDGQTALVDWDNHGKNSNHGINYIKPAPVKAGDAIRVNAPGWVGITVCTGVVASELNSEPCATFTTPEGHNRQALLKFVRAVVSPTPAAVVSEPFMAGDRVQYGDSDQHTKLYRGALGTIKRIINSDGSIIGVQWDSFENEVPHTASYLHRQPIEPGCYVREVTGASVFGNSRPVEVFEVKDDKVQVQGMLGKFWTDAAKLVRVAPYIVGVDLANGPDQTVMAFTRLVTDPALNERITALETEAAGYLDRITELAHWTAANMNVPVGTDDVFEVVRKVMTEQREALKAITDDIVKTLPTVRQPSKFILDWLARWAPEVLAKPPVQFKRGDKVTWGAEAFTGRITTLHPVRDHHEVIILSCDPRRGDPKEYVGKFTRPAITDLRPCR